MMLILTLRADFYDRPLAYSELGRLILEPPGSGVAYGDPGSASHH